MVSNATNSRRGRKPKHHLPPLAERLVLAREQLGATQKDIAERLDCGWRSVQDYEQGRAVPGGKVLAGYRKLGVDLNWLLSDSNHASPPPENDFVAIPHFHMHDVPANFTSPISRPPVIQIARSLLEHFASDPNTRVNGGQLGSLTVADDLMAPEVPIESIVVFDLTPVELEAEGLHVLCLGNRLVVRLFRPALHGGFEIVELKRPARSRTIEKSDPRLPLAYRVVATLLAGADT